MTFSYSTPYPPSITAQPSFEQIVSFSSAARCFITFVNFQFPCIHRNCFSANDTIHRAPAATNLFTVVLFFWVFFFRCSFPFAARCCCHILTSSTTLCCLTVNPRSPGKKQRHPKRPQLPPGEAGTPTKRMVHKVVYKQKLQYYNNSLQIDEQYSNQLLLEQAAELDKII